MKRTYEAFWEIADDFVMGEHWTHACSDHTADECLPWQHGVREFAKWLDEVGVKIIENPEIYETLWENVRTHKPTEYAMCSKGEANETQH